MTFRCIYCKGTLNKGTHDFISKVNDQVVIIRELPALICEQCGEAFYEDEAMEKIEIVRKRIDNGSFVAHPIAAGVIDANDI